MLVIFKFIKFLGPPICAKWLVAGENKNLGRVVGVCWCVCCVCLFVCLLSTLVGLRRPNNGPKTYTAPPIEQHFCILHRYLIKLSKELFFKYYKYYYW
jgi:hypothetical protein